MKSLEVFSPAETKVLKILGAKKLAISDIADTYFKGVKKPLTPNNAISSAILSINKKCKYHKLNWYINGAGLGRAGKVVWKDK